MKSNALIILMLALFVSVSIAESGCFCLDEGADHISKDNHSESEEKSSEQGNCSHICMQCHFVAITDPAYTFYTDTISNQIQFYFSLQYPRSFSQILYRPPIA